MRKETILTLPNGARVKVASYDYILPDFLLDVAAKSYAFEIRSGENLHIRPSVEVRKAMVKIR